MPKPSPQTSSPQPPRPAASGLRAALSAAWTRLLQRPFPRLVSHFAALILQSGQESGASELNLGIGGLLALLAAPGAFVSIMLFEKYSSLLRWLRHRPQFDVYWESLPDKYFFIVLSMVITGVVVAIKWDKILPSRQDYDNLAPLPLSSRTVFFANLCAIVVLASVFALDVNAISSVLFPGVVLSEKGTFPQLGAFIAVHALCVILASAFTFLACFAVMGFLMSALPRRAFRAASLVARLAIIVSLILLLSSSFAVLPAIRAFPKHPDSLVRLLPPVWYVGLYQTLQGRSNPELAAAAATGLEAVAVALLCALAFSALSYRRYYVRIPESVDARQIERRWSMRWFSSGLDRALLRSPFQRACYHFSLKALWRSETHCMVFGAFVGLGLVLTSQQILSGAPAVPGRPADPFPSVSLLAAPLVMAYFVIIGLRFVFEVPAGLNANWLYRLIVGSRGSETGAVARKIVLTFLVPAIVAPSLAIYAWIWGWRIGAVHALYVLAMSLLLMEIVLLRFRKIPFTCGLPSFRNNAIMLAFIYFIGFFAFTSIAAAVERSMLRWPPLLLALPVFFGLCWDALRRIKRDTPEIDLAVIYENAPPRAVQTLDILFGASSGPQ